MKTIADIRRDNLDLLIKEFGSATAVASKGNTDPVYISQVRNRTPDKRTGRPRSMGSAMARRLEEGCKKPHGWMDVSHAEADAPVARPLHTGEREPLLQKLTQGELDMVLSYRALLTDDDRRRFRDDIMAEAARALQVRDEVLRHYGAKGTADPARVAKALPMRPDGPQPDTVPGALQDPSDLAP